VASDTSNPTGWVWRLTHERTNPRMVNIKNHGKPAISIMVWGAIWLGGRSELIIMERDPDAPKNGYTSWSYIEALELGLLPEYDAGRIFQQDNAKIHVSNATKEWFESHGIWVIDWPPHSPDMNPIEHVWRALKAILHRQHPNIHLLGSNREDIETLKGWIREAWWAVPQELIDKLILSIPNRVRALRKAKGWYTKY
jgi:transposase